MARREVKAGEEFEMRLDVVNVSRKVGRIVKVEAVVPFDGFMITSLSSNFSPEDGSLQMKGMDIGVFQIVTGKLSLKAKKTGKFLIDSRLVYFDDIGDTKTCKLEPVVVTVKPAEPLSLGVCGRVPSGFGELDHLLMGGIPKNLAVVLAASSSDEKERIVNCFLTTSAKSDKPTVYLTNDPGKASALIEKHQSSFFVFICNPRADTIMKNLANVTKLKGVENLTEIDIALTKTLRTLATSAPTPRRACVAIVSDVLLQHHALLTRKWLDALISDLKAKGFTILAVIDPSMHPLEEVEAILSLFDGEIRIFEKEMANGMAKTLRVLRLQGQNYLKGEVTIG